jgi:hypothetical protein
MSTSQEMTAGAAADTTTAGTEAAASNGLLSGGSDGHNGPFVIGATGLRKESLTKLGIILLAFYKIKSPHLKEKKWR